MPSIEDWKTKPQTTAEPSTAVIEDKQTPESPGTYLNFSPTSTELTP